ncbi:hypothetical protein BGS_0979 [Beggiatoa sp. SS]|nr:hypothetical protein BGS_0979 [Beggiatoa sp. SS]
MFQGGFALKQNWASVGCFFCFRFIDNFGRPIFKINLERQFLNSLVLFAFGRMNDYYIKIEDHFPKSERQICVLVFLVQVMWA